MNDTPRTDAEVFLLFKTGDDEAVTAEFARKLERENVALRNEVARLNNQTNWVCSCGGTDCAGHKENAALRQQLEQWEQSTQWFAKWAEKKQELERENARLQIELDGSCNAEELRQVRACVDRTCAANDRLVVENAALRKDKDRFDWLITKAPFCVLSTLSSDPAAARLKIDREMEFPTV